jgi:hypothetical protein
LNFYKIKIFQRSLGPNGELKAEKPLCEQALGGLQKAQFF